MEYTEFESLFLSALSKNNLPALTQNQIKQFHLFAEHLMEVNRITNLTAIRNIPDVITKHFVDSLFASELIPLDAKVLDLGCGPGFPSIPLSIARPDLTITALDSTAKKIAFVNEAIQLLNLPNIKGVSGRAEDRVLLNQLGQFDVVTGRAVARLNILCELCIPYARIGGLFLALKASKGDEELLEAQRAIKMLGGANPEIISKQLITEEGALEPRCLIKITKSKTTPNNYPRAYAAILKKPL